MKKYKIISTITTITDAVIAAIFLLITIVASVATDRMADFTGNTINHLQTINPDSVVAGYEVIGTMMGSALGGLGIIVLWIVAFLSVIAMFYFLVPVIIAVLAVSRIKKFSGEDAEQNIINTYIKDGKIKSVFNGIPAFILTAIVIFNYKTMLYLVIPAAVLYIVTGLSIYLVCGNRHME